MGGSIGSALNGLVDILIGGKPTLEVQAYNGSTSASSKITVDPDDIGATASKVEIGADGRYYLRIVPTSAFNRIRIDWKNFAVVGLLAITKKMYVHDVFYNSGTALPCDNFLTTTFDAPGISATVLSSNPDPVRNPERAIDDDATNYSELGYSGILSAGILQTYSQKINFNSLSLPGEVAVVKFRVPGSFLTLSILDNIRVKVYNGPTVIYNELLGSLLMGDALGIISTIFGTNDPHYVTIPVTSQFDKVEVIYSQAITAGSFASPLRLYGIYRTPQKPTVANTFEDVCSESDVDLAVVSPETGVTYTWFNSSLAVIGTGTTHTVTAPASGLNDTFFVAASNCTNVYSEFVPVVVRANDTNCMPSTVSGSVDISDYDGTDPVYAVLVDGSGNVVATDVLGTTGPSESYDFPGVPKGDYEVVLIAAPAPPAIGSPIAGPDSDLGSHYEVIPNSQPASVPGDGSPVTVPGMDINKTVSDVTGTVDLTDYTSLDPVSAVLVDDAGNVVAVVPVDTATDTYIFTDVPRGDYEVVLVGGGVTPPTVGSSMPTPASDLGTVYEVTPSVQSVTVPGSVAPVTVPTFDVNKADAPDLRTSITASVTSIITGTSTSVTYRVFNIGTVTSSGTVYAVISKPSSGTLTLGTLPTGWSLLMDMPTGFIIQTTNSIAPGFPSSVAIPATYTASSSISLQNLTVDIPSGYGGGENDETNNYSSRQILINY